MIEDILVIAAFICLVILAVLVGIVAGSFFVAFAFKVGSYFLGVM